MNKIKLNKPWGTFKAELDHFVGQGSLLSQLPNVAIGKLVDNSTLALIYEAITHHKFNLLS